MPGDAPAIVRLFEEAGLHANSRSQDLEWKYWRPRDDWAGPRSFVLTDGSELIAHVAMLPGSCAGRTQRVKLGHVMDWAASPRAPVAGVALMNLVGQQQAVFAVGGSVEAVQILARIGFQVLGVVTSYSRPLYPLRLRRREGSASWKLAARVARSIAWTLTAPSTHVTDWRSCRLASGDISRITPAFPVPERGTGMFERSVDLFHYMLSCPIVPMELFAVQRANRVQGYYLLASAPGQVRIVDCWMDSEDPSGWCALILCAVEQAKHDPQAAEVVIWASDAALAQALEACGFHARFKTPILVRPAADRLLPECPLRVQMLDTDIAFIDPGRKEFWS